MCVTSAPAGKTTQAESPGNSPPWAGMPVPCRQPTVHFAVVAMNFLFDFYLWNFWRAYCHPLQGGEGARGCKHVGKEGSREEPGLSQATQSSGSNSKSRGPYSTCGNSPGEEFIRIPVTFTLVRINRSFQVHCKKIQTLYQGLRSCAVRLLPTQPPSDSADT